MIGDKGPKTPGGVRDRTRKKNKKNVISPGKVTRTSKMSSPGTSPVQRQAMPMTEKGTPHQVKTAWEWTIDPQIDTALRGTFPSVSSQETLPAKSASKEPGSHSLPRPQAARESVSGTMTEGSQLEEASAGEISVRTVIRPGSSPYVSTQSGGARSTAMVADAPREEVAAHNSVAPGGTPAVGTGGNDCVPSTASAVVAWDVVDEGTDWRANVMSLTLAGRIRINPWPSHPTDMVVPNTPNPVDGGNINNSAGSANHWQAAIDDMANYDTSGGGAGPNWHSTAASRAHEWAHWNEDYVDDAVMSNWSRANTRIDALREPKSQSATAAEARAALASRVNAEISAWRRATILRWNTLISANDKPGAGGRGYAAGAAVLATDIAAVRAYKNAKGW